MPRTAILLIDHGSRRAAANATLEAMAERVRAHVPEDVIVEPAHMELASPTIPDGFAACVAAGATEIVAVPYFLSAGRHATVDVPRLVAEAAEAHPDVRWRVADALGPHDLLAQLVVARAGL